MKEKKDLTIKIETTEGIWKNTFNKTDKVHEVIKAVIQHFGFAPGGNYEVRLANDPDTALAPERPLVSYGIENGDVLVFTDLGVAV